MFSATFWKQSAERSAKSAAQALLGLWALDGFNAPSRESNWTGQR